MLSSFKPPQTRLIENLQFGGKISDYRMPTVSEGVFLYNHHQSKAMLDMSFQLVSSFFY